MKYFITGGTGFIGNRLAEKLVADNHQVIILSRNPPVTDTVSPLINSVKGDLSNPVFLSGAMKGCEIVFHLAAFTSPWSKEPETPHRINVTGTENVLKAALDAGVKRVVLTSTAGTMGYSEDGSPVNETTNNNPRLFTGYEKSKAIAESLAHAYCSKGLEVVIVNPSRVYGPGKLTESNSMTKLISMYIKGLWRIVPGKGSTTGNYVYIDDIVSGHLLAAKYGKSGERYILGGENLSFSEIFSTIDDITGRKRIRIAVPEWILKTIVDLILVISKILFIRPFITREWLDKYMKDSILSSEKAINQLGYKITPFRSGVEKTIDWLENRI